MVEISPKECISFAWKQFKSRAGFFILAGIILFIGSAISDIPRALDKFYDNGDSLALGVVAFCVGMIVSFLISIGKTYFFLKAHDDTASVSLKDLWHPHPFLKYVAVSFIAGISTLIGLLLFIVPGIIIGIMVGFSLYIVVETGAGPIEAIKKSAQLTKGNRWNMFLLGLLLLGLNILGMCVFLIGLFVTLPVTTLAIVHAYRLLSRGSENVSTVMPTSATSADATVPVSSVTPAI